MAITDKKIYFLFPGQGAQYPGMALDLWEDSAAVKKLFETASDHTGQDMKALLREAGGETLKRTDVSQPAVTLANLAAAVYLEERGIHPGGCAGFSLGEYAALVTAGVIGAEDCFRLVKARGEAMQAAVDRIRKESPGGEAPGMAAVIGLEPERVLALIAEWTAAGLADLYPANINSPRQLAVAGTAAALAVAEEKFKAAGARRFIRLQVAGPFHSPLIAGAAEVFAQTLAAVPFGDPRIPLYSNVSGGPVSTGAEAKGFALAQISAPVRWVEEERSINRPEGPEAVLETGPGKVLQGLWKDSGSEIPCYAAGTAADIKLLLGGDHALGG
ncbi:MAG: ACP S-malonyltransferase [Treponema sp.]|jgi:[acyl-carrier-protein] S-malonyltransferase|nr:ACP S-malonyltransferase [Treponema sp.]